MIAYVPCMGVGCCMHVHTPTAPEAAPDEPLSVTRQIGSEDVHRLHGMLP